MKSRRAFTTAPFCDYLGSKYKDKKIFHTNQTHWAHIVHDMGHVFASKKNFSESDEFSFFAWELALVKDIKGSTRSWSISNHNYRVFELTNPEKNDKNGFQPYSDWSELSPRGKALAIRVSTKMGRKIKILSKDNKPLAIR